MANESGSSKVHVHVWDVWSCKILLVLVALLIFQSSAWAWNAYSELGHKLSNDTRVLLVEHGVCENINQCRSQERVFG